MTSKESKLKVDPKISAVSRDKSGSSKEEVRQRDSLQPVYRMFYNESPLGPCPEALAVINKRARTFGRYPAFAGEKLHESLGETLGHALTPDHFFTASGGYETLEWIAKALLRPGDECILSYPTLNVYNRVVSRQGVKIINVPLDPDGFTPNIEGILSAVNHKTYMVLLGNPNNPTGTIMTAEQMEKLVNQMPEHVFIVTDEADHHFVTRPDFPDSINYVLGGKNLIIMHSFSKAYGLAAIRLGYAIMIPQLAHYMRRQSRDAPQNRRALIAGMVALKDQAHLKKNIQMTLSGKQWLYNQFERLGLTYWPTQSNFVVVQCPIRATQIVIQLLPLGVMVRPLARAGLPYCLRVTVSTPEGNQAFIAALERVLGAT
ncbi:MAG: pyridoxal phosphate-dependent aminotransferase [Ardenticatenaceae bacterium]